MSVIPTQQKPEIEAPPKKNGFDLDGLKKQNPITRWLFSPPKKSQPLSIEDLKSKLIRKAPENILVILLLFATIINGAIFIIAQNSTKKWQKYPALAVGVIVSILVVMNGFHTILQNIGSTPFFEFPPSIAAFSPIDIQHMTKDTHAQIFSLITATLQIASCLFGLIVPFIKPIICKTKKTFLIIAAVLVCFAFVQKTTRNSYLSSAIFHNWTIEDTINLQSPTPEQETKNICQFATKNKLHINDPDKTKCP